MILDCIWSCRDSEFCYFSLMSIVFFVLVGNFFGQSLTVNMFSWAVDLVFSQPSLSLFWACMVQRSVIDVSRQKSGDLLSGSFPL